MPSKQPEYVDVTVYATIEGKWSTYWKDDKDRPILEGGRVVATTQNKPKGKAKAGALVTRLTLRIDADALLPLQPEAVIHIKAGDAQLIEVEADDPRTQEEIDEEEALQSIKGVGA